MFNFTLTPTVRNLMLANLLVFLLQENVRLEPSITQLGSLYPFGSPYLHFWQFFTHMFMHGGWGHLLSNMFGLLIFGPLLEQNWGGQRFVAFWLMCGVGAGLIYNGVRTYEIHQLNVAYAEVAHHPSAGDYDQFMQQSGFKQLGDEEAASALERNPNDVALRQAVEERIQQVHDAMNNSPYGMLGASGALFGIMFAFGYLFPNTEVYRFPIPFPIKAKYLVLFYAIGELYSGVHRTPGDNVAHFAHIGGMLVAFIILKFWESGRARFY
jgi:membrane associated rhomboid family serine protease